MKKDKSPVTPAIRALRAAGAAYVERPYDYVDKGGTTRASECLGVDEHAVVKTLVMEDEARQPLIVLMHGDCQVSTQKLARELGKKRIEPCSPEVAERHTGYKVGGTSPLGTKKRLLVYVEASIVELPVIYLNGGKRGFLVRIAVADLSRVLSPTLVDVATEK